MTVWAHAHLELTNESMISWPQVRTSGNDKLNHGLPLTYLANHPHHQVNILTVWSCNANSAAAALHINAMSLVGRHNLSIHTCSAPFQVHFNLLAHILVVFSKHSYLTYNITMGWVLHWYVVCIHGDTGIRDEVEGAIGLPVNLIAQRQMSILLHSVLR